MIISVNAKKRSDASGDPADASRYPVMLLDIRRCPHFSVNAPNFPGTFPSLTPLPYGTYEHENLHAYSIWLVFSEYDIKVKFHCLKTAWIEWPEFGLNLAWIFRRRYLLNPWVHRNDIYIFGMCSSRRRIWVLLGVRTTLRSKFENFVCSKKA